jgi:rhodanese-related sulfurtransferase
LFVEFLTENWMLIVIAVVSGAMLMWPAMGGGGKATVQPMKAVQMMNHEKAVVIDVCEPNEFANGHVGGARNVPLSQLEKQLEGAVKNKQLPLILVCASGMRSGRAVAVAKKLGYDNAYSLAGGMGAWRAANMPVSKG